jgi:hypothetical protein
MAAAFPMFPDVGLDLANRKPDTVDHPWFPERTGGLGHSLPSPVIRSKKGSQTTMGNKDRRKEKKKLKQPKAAPKPSNPGRPGSARPSN